MRHCDVVIVGGGLAGSLNGDRVFNSPQIGLAMIETDLKGLTADKVNAALPS